VNRLVSICIPTYNGERFFRECLQSALCQTFTEFELLIVDDGSTDSTVNLAKQFAGKDSRIRVVQNERNLGLVENWNRCIHHARGEWIKFLHQDDVLAPQCLEKMLRANRMGADLVVVRRDIAFEEDAADAVTQVGDYVTVNALKRYFPAQTHISGQQFAQIVLEAPEFNCIGEPTATLVRRSAFQRFGFFNTALVCLCDWEFCARVAVNTGLCYVDEPLAVFRVHSSAASGENRSIRHYRAFTIDKLIVRHEITYSRHFAAVRKAARNSTPARNLKMELADVVRRARWQALHETDSKAALTELRTAIKKYPRLLYVPPAYLLRWGMSKLGKARRIG
jgi:glycosyltransferase involved in cell wall biosynthesis